MSGGYGILAFEEDLLMSQVPPSQFSSYPRGPVLAPSLSADKLQALWDGYSGLNLVFVVNVVLVLAGNAIAGRENLPALFVVIGVVFVAIAALTYPYNRKIAVGKGWENPIAILASFLMGLNAALCCGIIGYVVMQQIALSEMRKYGLKQGFFGVKKAAVRAVIDELR